MSILNAQCWKTSPLKPLTQEKKIITHRNENVKRDKESGSCQDILSISFSSQENYSKTAEVGVQYDPFLESAAKLHRRISI